MHRGLVCLWDFGPIDVEMSERASGSPFVTEMLAKCDRNVACERRLSGLANVGKHRNELGHQKAGVPVLFVLVLIQALEYPSSFHI